MSLIALVEISRYYGSKTEYVLGGGGNTSWKDGQTLHIKASGASLGGACADSFIAMDRNALAQIWEKQYPETAAERESAVLADMLAARMPGEEHKRPSVETLLHDLIPFPLVVHLHPAPVNGLTCSQQGESAMKELFAESALWIPLSNPGYELAQTVKTAMDTYRAENGKAPPLIFLQNHGIFAGGACQNCIRGLYSDVMQKIGSVIKSRPDFSDAQRRSAGAPGPIAEVTRTLAALAGGAAIAMQGKEIAGLVQSRAAFNSAFPPEAPAFTPDHIVYAGSDPLFIEDAAGAAFQNAPLQETLPQSWDAHIQKHGRNPKIIAVEGMGVFGAAATEKAAGLALDLFIDAIKILAYTEYFGGPKFMARDNIDFINNWEAEHYRTAVSAQ